MFKHDQSFGGDVVLWQRRHVQAGVRSTEGDVLGGRRSSKRASMMRAHRFAVECAGSSAGR